MVLIGATLTGETKEGGDLSGSFNTLLDTIINSGTNVLWVQDDGAGDLKGYTAPRGPGKGRFTKFDGEWQKICHYCGGHRPGKGINANDVYRNNILNWIP